jgi:hypothetical protein
MSIKFIKFIFWTLLITGCYTSVITNTWKSKSIQSKEFEKILVIALVNQKDRSLRESMENHLVGDLIEKGITGISSLKEYGPKSFEGLKENEVIQKLDNSGIDAVITIVLLDKEKEKYYVPGRVYYTPYNIYHRRFWGYYSTMYDRIDEPGYYTENTNYFWESNFFDAKTKELIYSVQTKSFNPNSSNALANEYGKLICNDLFKNDILK